MITTFERIIGPAMRTWSFFPAKAQAEAHALAAPCRRCGRPPDPLWFKGKGWLVTLICAACYVASKNERDDARPAPVDDRILSCRRFGVPREIIDALALGVRETEAVLRVYQFLGAEKGKRLLVISGGSGVGKSVAAGYAIWEVGGLFVAAMSLAGLGVDQQQAWDAYERAGLLVLDDLGCEYADAKGWLGERIESLLCARMAEGRRTIATTNLDLEAFTRRYSERLLDRLRAAGDFVEIGGDSMRPGEEEHA